MKRLIVLIAASVFTLQSFAQTVTIGTQVWMTKNLDVSVFRNGDPIPQAKTDEEWEKAGDNKQPAWCYYENDPANGAKYGKLYNWYAVSDSRGLAPVGYHIPSDAEWTILTDYLGGAEKAGAKMKSKQGWAYDGNGTNSSGFSGLPGGLRYLDGTFVGVGEVGYWWSSTEGDSNFAWGRALDCCVGDVVRYDGVKERGFSVRCLRDNESASSNDVNIGTQVWMTKNLNVSTFRNGDRIPQAKTNEEWKKAGDNGQPAWCYYENDPANGAKYGKLYNWYAVSDSRGLAPVGYHIPSDAEWTILTDYLGGEQKAGAEMKSKQAWAEEGNGTNSSGFSGLPGGYRGDVGAFYGIGERGDWWSSTESIYYGAKYRYLLFGSGSVGRGYEYSEFGYSVRCLKD